MLLSGKEPSWCFSVFLALHIFSNNWIHQKGTPLRGFIAVAMPTSAMSRYHLRINLRAVWPRSSIVQVLCTYAHKFGLILPEISQLLIIPSSSSLSSLNPTSNSLLNRLSVSGSFGLPGTLSSRRPSSSSSSPSRLSPLNLLLPCEMDGRRSQEGIWERKYAEEER